MLMLNPFLLPENELQQPGSPSVKKSEEKGIVTVHEVKCKLYVKVIDMSYCTQWDGVAKFLFLG